MPAAPAAIPKSEKERPMNETDLDKKLEAMERRHEELNHLLAQPETAADPALLQRYGREIAGLTDVVQAYKDLTSVRRQLADTEAMLANGLDDDLRALAQEELASLRARKDDLLHDIQVALLPKDIMDERNAIVTIQAGAGGDEAALFAADLYRMYTRYAESNHWTVEILNTSISSAGGYREVI